MNKLYEKIQERADRKLQKDFLPEALEIIEKPASPIGHLVIWVIFATLISAALWSYFGRVDEMVTARGTFRTDDGVKTIQAVSSGKVTGIFVKEGDYVKKGQPVMKLSASLKTSMYENSSNKAELLRWKQQILRQIRTDKELDLPEQDRQNKEKMDFIEYVGTAAKDFHIQKQQLESELDVMKTQIEEEQAALSLLMKEQQNLAEEYEQQKKLYPKDGIESETLKILKEDLKFLKKEADDYRDLYIADALPKKDWEAKQREFKQKQQAISLQKKKVRTEQTQREMILKQCRNKIETKSAEYEVQKKKVEQKKEEKQQKKNSLKSLEYQFEQKISAMLVEINTQISDQDVETKGQKEQLSNCTLTAPCDGIIKQLAVNTEGGVVTESETVGTILPEHSALIFEAALSNKDKGDVAAGQDAVIKVDAYDYQKYGKVEGKVAYISADAIADENKGLIYKVKLKTSLQEFVSKNPDTALTSGMEGTMEIKIGQRRIIEFFLEPLVDSVEGSLNLK